jgi:hypothetical protein
VAAQQGLQLPGDIFQHKHSSASAKADAAFPSGVAKPYLSGTQFLSRNVKDVAALHAVRQQRLAYRKERSPVQESGIGIHEASGK